METTSAITDQLRAERTRHEQDIAIASKRCAELTIAIDALEGRADIKVNGGSNGAVGPTVVDMVIGVARELPEGTVFDAKLIKPKAVELFPTHAHRIKTGIYNAFTTLEKQKKIERAPGGFRVKA